MAASNDAKASGSQRLLAERMSKATTVSHEDIKRLVELAELEETELVYVLTHGVPAVDRINGTFRTTPDQLGALATGLIQVSGISYEVFPFGIPFPEEILVNIVVGGDPVEIRGGAVGGQR